MSTDLGQHNGQHNGQHRTPAADPAAIERDIARQRDQLAQTVDALGHKLDVKARAEAKAADLRDAATTESGMPRPELWAAGAALVAGIAALVWWRSRS
jgi:hypothetical protein